MAENESKNPEAVDSNGLAPIINESLTRFKAEFLGHPLFSDVVYLVELTRRLLSEKARLNAAAEKLVATTSTLDDLRVFMKYQAFDLEASRRENESLKTLLSEHGIDPN